MAFDTWLQSAGEVSANTIGRGIRQPDPPSRLPPKQLPVILQALLSPVGSASMKNFVFCFHGKLVCFASMESLFCFYGKFVLIPWKACLFCFHGKYFLQW